MLDSNETKYLLPNIDFHKIMKDETLSPQSKKTIWKYLQLILFIIIGKVDNENMFGESAKLIEAINNENIEKLGEIYKKIMLINKDKIDRNKIILGHNEIYADWLELECIFSIKPNKKIHRLNYLL